MTSNIWIKRGAIIGSVGIGVFLVVLLARTTRLGAANTWQRLVSPGRLSASHAFLENDCAACHTAIQGPEAGKCIACHANNESLLQRQPSVFHADIGSCRECHREHRGIDRRPTDMDHTALARIGLQHLQSRERADGEDASDYRRLLTWMDRRSGVPPVLSPEEAVLDCAACHNSKDHHFQLFGRDCGQCHSTAKWTIPEFRHPSPHSTDCAQCHQAPPSHFMGHFNMVCRKVAGKPRAQVSQCHLCHQTTSWNDIKGVGWYKHH